MFTKQPGQKTRFARSIEFRESHIQCKKWSSHKWQQMPEKEKRKKRGEKKGTNQSQTHVLLLCNYVPQPTSLILPTLVCYPTDLQPTGGVSGHHLPRTPSNYSGQNPLSGVLVTPPSHSTKN